MTADESRREEDTVSGGGDVREIRNDGRRTVAANEVSIRQGGAGRVFARDVRVRQGGIGLAKTDSIRVSSGAVGGVFAREASLEQTTAHLVVASKEARLDQAASAVVVAESVHATQSVVGFLVARNVSGDVRVMFGPRAAFAFGAGLACVIGGFRLLHRLFR